MHKYLEKIKDKKIHVVGVSGDEGSAIIKFLVAQGFNSIVGHDFCEKEDFKKNFDSFHDALSKEEKEMEFKEIKKLEIKINFKDEYLKDIEEAEIIFVPQSWFRYKFNEKLKELQDKTEFSNITKLYFNLCKAPIVAVTGTSGKSTTTRLIYEIFKKDRESKSEKVYFSGNDRENIQILDKILDIKKEDLLILEVSNRQLKIDLENSPHIGVVTNISHNHMDDHDDFNDYVEVKKSLLENQEDDDIAILNYSTKELQSISLSSTVRYFSTDKKIREGSYLFENDLFIASGNSEYKICSKFDLHIPGIHNIENVLAASLACYLGGVNTKVIREVVTNFKGLKSRIELIRELNGVKYYNDSSACNPEGLQMAISSFTAPIILVAGGTRSKDVPDEMAKMTKSIINNNVKVLLLIGDKAESIRKKVEETMVKNESKEPFIRICTSLQEAVKIAHDSARPRDVVILSPGCESFDMFKDYRDRANQYIDLVKNL